MVDRTQYKLAREFNTAPPKMLSHDMTMMRRLAEIQRWAVVPVLRRQSVAEHSFHVVYMARIVAEHHALLCSGNYRAQLLDYAIDHDRIESMTGDKPSPYKRWLKLVNPGVVLEPPEDFAPDVSAMMMKAIKQVVKIADFLEALIFLEEEVALGNKRLFAVRADVWVNYVAVWQEFDWNGPPFTAPPDGPKVVFKPSAEQYYHWWQQMLDPTYHPGLAFNQWKSDNED